MMMMMMIEMQMEMEMEIAPGNDDTAAVMSCYSFSRRFPSFLSALLSLPSFSLKIAAYELFFLSLPPSFPSPLLPPSPSFPCIATMNR
eukprot:m.33301 g.33301  ORF g.33301 m.33301 type:complete len:88 (-) comp10871_c0_seq5:922-1185(-)